MASSGLLLWSARIAFPNAIPVARGDIVDPGSGLGLVTAVAERFGGEVRTEDNDPEGTVVVVELRRAETAE